MTNPTTPFSWQMPTSTDLVTDLPADFAVFGQAVATSMADLLGGTTGQVLSKASNTDMDFTWVAQDDSNAIQNAIVDAKGDLIAASANDTPARLAVGNNGETLVADSSTSTGLRYQGTMAAGKNAIINGGMDIWQRGTSGTFSSSVVYPAADRWFAACIGSAPTCTMSQQTADTVGLRYGLRFGRNSGQTNTGGVYVGSVVETASAIPFAGKTVTLSFYAKRGADASASLGVQLYTGTGTDQSAAVLFSAGWTGGANTISTSQSLTTTMTRYSFTATLPSTTSEISVTLSYAPSGTAGANEWYQIEGVQVEVGSVATNFTRAGGTIQGELAACQRYYVRFNTINAYNIFGTGINTSTTASNTQIPLPVQMRTAPSAIEYSTLGVAEGGGSIVAVTSATFAYGSVNEVSLTTNVASGLTQYRPVHLFSNNSTSSYLGFSAEL